MPRFPVRAVLGETTLGSYNVNGSAEMTDNA